MHIIIDVNVNLNPSAQMLELCRAGFRVVSHEFHKLELKMSDEFDKVKQVVVESNTLMEAAVSGLTTMAGEVRRLADELTAANGDRVKLAELTGKLAELGSIADQGNDALAAWVSANTPDAPAPVDPAPVDPAPVDPAPVDPAPVDPAPVDPAPVDPAPVDPAPTEPAPVDPAPAPTPTEPAPVDPAPVDPAPVDPAPADPAPADPAPAPDAPAPAEPAAVTAAKRQSGTPF